MHITMDKDIGCKIGGYSLVTSLCNLFRSTIEEQVLGFLFTQIFTILAHNVGQVSVDGPLEKILGNEGKLG